MKTWCKPLLSLSSVDIKLWSCLWCQLWIIPSWLLTQRLDTNREPRFLRFIREGIINLKNMRNSGYRMLTFLYSVNYSLAIILRKVFFSKGWFLSGFVLMFCLWRGNFGINTEILCLSLREITCEKDTSHSTLIRKPQDNVKTTLENFGIFEIFRGLIQLEVMRFCSWIASHVNHRSHCKITLWCWETCS